MASLGMSAGVIVYCSSSSRGIWFRASSLPPFGAGSWGRSLRSRAGTGVGGRLFWAISGLFGLFGPKCFGYRDVLESGIRPKCQPNR